jgi:hypothetical protein
MGLGEDYFVGKQLTADPNYHSEENLKKCEAEQIDAYIPDVNFRKRDPRLAGQEKYKAVPVKKFSLADFTYNAEQDGYLTGVAFVRMAKG